MGFLHVHLASQQVEQLERRPWADVPEADYAVYSAVLRHLSQQTGRSDWVVRPMVDSFPDLGAVLELADGSKRRLTPQLEAAQDIRQLSQKLGYPLHEDLTSIPEGYLQFTRVARDSASGEAVVSFYGTNLGMGYLMLGADGVTLTEVEYKWDYGGAYGLPEGALSSDEVMAGAMPFLAERLEGTLGKLRDLEAGGEAPPELLLLKQLLESSVND